MRLVHCSYNEFHLGDNLVHLHFLRELAIQYQDLAFHHAVHTCYIPQLAEAIVDVPNVKLVPLEDLPRGSSSRWVNVWKNAGAGTSAGGYWEKHALRNDYSGFYLAWFQHLSEQMGLSCPIRSREDLLFRYPKIQKPTPISGPFDFLIINSQPSSGQFRAYDCVNYFDPLIAELCSRYRCIVTQKSKLPVPCTTDYGLTISQVGHLSLCCPYIIMVSTGPSWPTFNIWNRESVKLRIVGLDNEILNLAPNTVQVRRLEEIVPILKERNLL